MSELMRFNNFLNLPSIKHITASSRWLKKSYNIICVCIYSLCLGGKTHSVREWHLFRDLNKTHQKTRAEFRLTSRKIYSINCITAFLIFCTGSRKLSVWAHTLWYTVAKHRNCSKSQLWKNFWKNLIWNSAAVSGTCLSIFICLAAEDPKDLQQVPLSPCTLRSFQIPPTIYRAPALSWIKRLP